MGSSAQATTFWGMAIFEAESYDKIMEVLTHPEYLRTVGPDELNMLDRSKSQIFAGTTNTFWNADLVSPRFSA